MKSFEEFKLYLQHTQINELEPRIASWPAHLKSKLLSFCDTDWQLKIFHILKLEDALQELDDEFLFYLLSEKIDDQYYIEEGMITLFDVLNVAQVKCTPFLQRSLQKSLFQECIKVTFDVWKKWKKKHLPLINHTAWTCIYSSFFEWNLPVIKEPDSEIYRHELQFLLNSKLQLGQDWSVLFSTAKHGFSFRQFEHFVEGYPGTSILIFRGTSQPLGVKFGKSMVVGGCVISKGWKFKRNPWNDEHCKMFFLYPALEWFDVFPDTNDHLKCNEKDGIILGKNRLCIQNDFSRAVYSALDDCCFPYSSLYNDVYKIDIEQVEVFGFSGEQGLRKWKYEKAFEKKVTLNRQSVNIKADKQMIEWLGIHQFNQ